MAGLRDASLGGSYVERRKTIRICCNARHVLIEIMRTNSCPSRLTSRRRKSDGVNDGEEVFALGAAAIPPSKHAMTYERFVSTTPTST